MRLLRVLRPLKAKKLLLNTTTWCTGCRKQKQTKWLRYTPVEDHMILQAVEFHGRNWYYVLTFMNEHRDVLWKEAGQSSEIRRHMRELENGSTSCKRSTPKNMTGLYNILLKIILMLPLCRSNSEQTFPQCRRSVCLIFWVESSPSRACYLDWATTVNGMLQALCCSFLQKIC